MAVTLPVLTNQITGKLSLTQLCFESIFSPMPGDFLEQGAFQALLLAGGTPRKEHGPSDSRREKAGLRFIRRIFRVPYP